MQNALKTIEWQGACVLEIFKIEKFKYRRGSNIIHLFCRIGFPQEITSSLFSLKKLEKK